MRDGENVGNKKRFKVAFVQLKNIYKMSTLMQTVF